MKMMITIKRGSILVFLSLLLVGLSGCASLPDGGGGVEHERGESEKRHKH